ncbi:hypothetical protein LCGC14_2502430, partial [marine sediment metagenome]
MRVAIHVNPAMDHHIKWGITFAEGLRRHGINASIESTYTPVGCDLAVFWGHSPVKSRIINAQKEKGRHYLVMERGYFADRFKWASLGYNGLNGQADFCNVNSPPDRWEPHKYLMKSWNPGKDYVLLVGQIPADSSCSHINIQQWYVESVMKARAIQDLPVVYRHHPKHRNPSVPCGIEVMDGSLEDCLKGAACVITFSSTVGVDALLAGKPVVAVDPISMAWPLAGHSVKE